MQWDLFRWDGVLRDDFLWDVFLWGDVLWDDFLWEYLLYVFFADDDMPPVILHVVVAALQHCWLWLSALMFGICSEGFRYCVYS